MQVEWEYQRLDVEPAIGVDDALKNALLDCNLG